MNASRDGTDYISYQHYLDTDAMQKDGSDDLGIANDFNAYDNSYTARTIFDENNDIIFSKLQLDHSELVTNLFHGDGFYQYRYGVKYYFIYR